MSSLALEDVFDDIYYGVVPAVNEFVRRTNSEILFYCLDEYGFDDNVMLALFSYAAEKRALHRNYIQATADAWAKNNIKTFVDLDEYFG